MNRGNYFVGRVLKSSWVIDRAIFYVSLCEATSPRVLVRATSHWRADLCKAT